MNITGNVNGSASGMLSLEGDGDKIDVTQVLTEGTKIATITINEWTEEEESVDLYAPEGFSGSWNDLTDKPDLFNGAYADLTGKPTLNGDTINGNMYSKKFTETEQRIGTWIDGKPLYQKTCVFGSVSGTNANLPLNIANVDFISLCTDGSVVNGICPIPYVTGSQYNNNIGGFFSKAADNTNFAIRIGSAMAGSVNSVVLTVQYTKTTDSVS